ncbi:hypothetical protein Btru_024325 [Bulinus truncatus]|nr:hypothetical protein Btru_024325 [Bulinus truncatus]
MDNFIGGLLLVTFLVLLLLHWLNRSNGRPPPCPVTPLPIVGHLLFLERDIRPQLRKWTEQCGDIFSLHMGSRLFVVINGFKLIKELSIQRSDEFSDKPVPLYDEFMGYEEKGIISTSGCVWLEQRVVVVNHLKKICSGKTERIEEEVANFMNHLITHSGQDVDIDEMTTASIANVLCSILTGQRKDYNAPAFKRLLRQMKIFKESHQSYFLLSCFPILQCIPLRLKKQKELMKNIEELYRHFDDFIDESKHGDSEESLIAAYWAERRNRIMKGKDTNLDNKHLLKVVFDLFIAGLEPTSNTICWFVLYILHYPEVQAKIFEEIVQHVGMDRLPKLEDANKLTYLNATIMEIQRLVSLYDQTMYRTCKKDNFVKGYLLPKGSVIVPNLDSIFMDEKIWGSDAEHFNPERFIQAEGKLKSPEEFIPFSFGRRACLGEGLARAILFLYLSSMLQRFQFLPVSPDKLPSMKRVCGFSAKPEPFLVIISEHTH